MSKVEIENRCWIAGEFTHGTGRSFDIVNPATLDKTTTVHGASEADINRAVEAAKAAQPAWANAPAEFRAQCLNKWADLLVEHADTLAYLDSVAMGRPVREAQMHAQISAGRCRYDAGLATTVTGDSSLLSAGNLNITFRQPYGVVAAIIPWNVPLIMLTGKIAPAVAAGNAIVLKSSEKAPLACAFAAGLTKAAGFPDGVVNVVTGLGDIGKVLAEHPEIRKISFTGSTRTGRLVMQAAAQSNLKDVALELGGKSPTVIFDDADLGRAVPGCAFSLQFNSGQICMAGTRLYVQKGVAAEFKKQFLAAFGTFVHGDPADPNTTLGPQADEVQNKIVMSYLDIGNKEGKAEIGGTASKSMQKGYFIEPTIFSGVPHNSRINQEEVFGPVATIFEFETEEEAVRMANESEYGLYASVFTANIDRAIRVAKRLEAGHVGVNTTSPASASQMPFGGFKSSGVGREGGLDDVKRWTEEKSVIISVADK